MEIQPVSIPTVDHTIVSKSIKMIFEYIHSDGMRCLECFKGNVIYVSKSESKK